jgi:hypothetical protein
MRRRRRRLRSQIEWWLHLISTVLGKAFAFGAHEVGFEAAWEVAAFLQMVMKHLWTRIVG